MPKIAFPVVLVGLTLFVFDSIAAEATPAEIRKEIHQARTIEDLHHRAETFILLGQRILIQNFGPHTDPLLNALLNAASGIQAMEERAFFYNGLANFLIRQNLPENRFVLFEKLMDEALKMKERQHSSKVLANMIRSILSFKLQEKALPLFDRMIALRRGEVLHPLILAFGPLWEEGKAIISIEKLLTVLETMPEDPELGKLLGILASQLVDAKVGNQRKAFFERILGRAKKIGNIPSKAVALCLIASAWSYRAPLVEVQKIFTEVLTLAEQIPEGNERSEILSLVGYHQQRVSALLKLSKS